MKGKIFAKEDFSEEKASIRKGLLQIAKDFRLQNKVANFVCNKLTVYKQERGNDIYETQGDT